MAIMDLLPHDMLLKVFDSTRFRPVDLLVCSSCCRQWREIISSIMQGIRQVDLCHSCDRKNLALLNLCKNAEVVRIRGAFHSFMHLQRHAPCLGARGHTQTLAHLNLQCCANLTDDMVVGMQILGRFTWLTENNFNISNRRPGITWNTQRPSQP